MANLVLNGRSIDSIDDIAENFVEADVLKAFCSGSLVSWLDEYGYDDELERVRSIKQTDSGKSVLADIREALNLDDSVIAQANAKREEQQRKEEVARKAREEQRRMDEAVCRRCACVEPREPPNTRKAKRDGANSQRPNGSMSWMHVRSTTVPDFDAVTDFDSAVKIYKRAAELGDATAQQYLGYCYFLGKGVVENNEMGIYWTQKSAEAGNIMALHLLIRCCESKLWIDGIEDNHDTMFRYWNDKLSSNPDYNNPKYKIFDNTNRRHIAGENGFWSVLEKGAGELYYSGKSLLANCLANCCLPIEYTYAIDMFACCTNMRDLRYGKYAFYQMARVWWLFPDGGAAGLNKYTAVCHELKFARDKGCHEAEHILKMVQGWCMSEHQKYGRVDWGELFRTIDCPPDVSV